MRAQANRALRSASLLRWAGSKAKLLPDLKRVAPREYQRYIEPFAGSACLFFAIEPHRAILGDINPELANLYNAIKTSPQEVYEALTGIPANADGYYRLRAVDPHCITNSQRAARLIFLMKACFNGVYRTNMRGEFNVPMGNRVYALPTLQELIRASVQMQNAEILLGDYAKTIELSAPGDWIYLDPPYRNAARYRGEYGYAADFNKDHMTLFIERARRLADNGRFVTVSYYYDEGLIASFPGWFVHRASARRSVAGNTRSRGRVAELILTSYQ